MFVNQSRADLTSKIQTQKVTPDIEQEIKRCWNTLKSAIINKDVETAVDQFAPVRKEKYRKMITDPSYEMDERFKEVIRIEMKSVTEDRAQVWAVKMEAQGEIAYIVKFVKVSGSWKVYEF
jgi:hypothetical protein